MAIKKFGPVAQGGKSKPSGFGAFNLAPVQSPSRGLWMPHLHARPAQEVVFELNSALAKTDSTADATIVQAFDGQLTQQYDIQNPPAKTNYMFAGSAGERGWAFFDFIEKRYIIISGFDCCRLPFSDDFSIVKDGWHLTDAGGVMEITGGVMTASDISVTGGVGWRCGCTPRGSGWVLTLSVDILDIGDPGTFGTVESILLLSNSGIFEPGTLPITSLQLFNTAGTIGWRANYPSGTTALTGGWTAGDEAKLTVTENGGSYDIRFYVNDVLKHTASGETITFAKKVSFGCRGRVSQNPAENPTGACTFDNISISKA